MSVCVREREGERVNVQNFKEVATSLSGGVIYRRPLLPPPLPPSSFKFHRTERETQSQSSIFWRAKQKNVISINKRATNKQAEELQLGHSFDISIMTSITLHPFFAALTRVPKAQRRNR